MSTRRQVGRHMAKSKDKLERRSRKGRLADKGGSQYGSSDDESCDTMSMLSQDSTLHRGSQESEPAEEEAVCDESFDDKLKMFLDSALESKSSQRRTAYLQSLTRCLISNYCPEFLADRPATLSDLVEKSLRKGKEEEQIAAATLISVVALQYGASPEGASIQQSLKRIFVQLLMNESISARVRERVAYALALTTYMAEGDPYNISEVMEILKAIYSNSCPDINGKSPAVTPAESALHQTALQSWGLLLTVTEECAHSLVDKTLATVTALLHSSEIEMKIAAGEVLAAMYEIARERDNEFVGDDLEELCEVLHMLATDSQKFRGKKERRVQRASFRDIEKAIRDGDKPDFDVRFNGMERVQVRNWETKRTYDSVCSLLGSGMNHHLQFNPQVRDLFGLGSPVLVTNMNLGAPKLERMQYNQMDKARTKRLAKCRDKRLDIM